MDFTNRVCQVLHDEHRATIALMERLEQLTARRRDGPPDAKDQIIAQFLSDLSNGIESEVQRHFAFEEDHLFTYLVSIGDDSISAHLTGEHKVILPIGERIANLARRAMEQGFDNATWDEFRRCGQELCERMLAHVQKEEMALLPLLEENMDAEIEMRLFQEYSENV